MKYQNINKYTGAYYVMGSSANIRTQPFTSAAIVKTVLGTPPNNGLVGNFGGSIVINDAGEVWLAILNPATTFTVLGYVRYDVVCPEKAISKIEKDTYLAYFKSLAGTSSGSSTPTKSGGPITPPTAPPTEPTPTKSGFGVVAGFVLLAVLLETMFHKPSPKNK